MNATVLWSSAVISLWNAFRKCNSEESMLIIQIKPLQKVPFTMSTFFRLELSVIAPPILFMQKTVTELLLINFSLVSAEWKSIFWLKKPRRPGNGVSSYYCVLVPSEYRLYVCREVIADFWSFEKDLWCPYYERYTMQSHKKID